MAFKINVSHDGMTYKIESENESLVGKRIGGEVDGGEVDDNLKGYGLEVTGVSDLSGIPGFRGLEGSGYHRRLLTYGPGMRDKRKGIRLRKTNRGEEISLKIHQINMKVVKEGDKKFEELVGNGKGDGDQKEEVKKDDVKDKKEEVKEEKKIEKSSEVKEESKIEDVKAEEKADGSEGKKEEVK
ncbi:hypothetical protein CMI42_00575 [Candidatus Pacearchaeota archaeon]|nr:hypothetical protein [Candidatus Pacearchaeota archaeon]|tara:strand:+ start:1803 stop:2354 length:552 start_codon:yes stop_codon:yes gene_type:complete